MQLNSFAKFAWGTLVVNIGVILWGAFVRATGSGAGCGSHWPLCNGEVVPLVPQIQTVIEFIHRLTSGAAFLMVIALAVWAWRAFPPGHRIRGGVVAAVLGMIAESLAGASLVLFRWTALDISVGRIFMMPVHLIITYSLLAALTLTAWWASGARGMRWRGQGMVSALLGGGLVATLVMSMAGALTALGDTVLPVSSLTAEKIDTLSPVGLFLINSRIGHPVVAVIVGAYLLYLVQHLYSADSPRLKRLALMLGAMLLIQLVAGLLNIYLQAPVWMQLVHLLLANIVWIILVILAATRLAVETNN